MALLDLTSNVKGLQQLLGINGWQLSTCSFSYVGNTGVKETLTFLDMSGLLKSNGFNLDLSAIPVAQTLANALNNPSSLPFFPKTADEAGRTYFTRNQDTFKNQIMQYERPNNTPVLQDWGANTTTFTVSVILAGEGYLTKLRALQKFLSENLGERGGTFSHSVYGIFENVFVEDFSVLTQPAPFNASIIEIKFITANNNVKKSVTTSTINRINSFVNDALNTLSIVGSVGDIQTQLKTIYPNFFFPEPQFASIPNEFIQVERTSTTSLKGTATNLKETDPNLSNAVTQLNESGIPLDYDVTTNTQIIIEKYCQYAGVIVQSYGQGGLSTSSTQEIIVDDPTRFINTSSSSVDGVITTVSYQTVGLNPDGTYTILEDTVTTTPINRPLNEANVQVQIDDLIIVAGVMSKLNSDLYYTYTTLVSSLENLVNTTFKNGTNTEYTLVEDMPPARVANKFNLTLDEFYSLNTAILTGHRMLRKGMTVTVRQIL